MIKYILIVIMSFLNSIQVLAQDNFIGTWESNEGKLYIEIYQQQKSYYAKIKKSTNKEIIGKEVLIQMVKKSDGKLYGGTYYDEELKEEFEAKIKLVNKDKIRLKIFSGIFSKVVLWKRVHPFP